MYWYLEVMKKYAVFSGRASRKEFWMFQLVNIVIAMVLVAGIFIEAASSTPSMFFILLVCGYGLATIIPSLAVSARRLHDINFSGWWLLLSLVPGGGIVLLVFYVLESNPGPNQYGPNPYATLQAGAAQYAVAGATGGGPALPNPYGSSRFCSDCGTLMQPGTRFCPKCGKAAY